MHDNMDFEALELGFGFDIKVHEDEAENELDLYEIERDEIQNEELDPPTRGEITQHFLNHYCLALD